MLQAWVAALCLGVGAAAAQSVAAPATDAYSALMATALPPPAVQWFHLADALAQARARPGDEERAALLRHRLLAAHTAELNEQAVPQPTLTVAAGVAQATALSPQGDPALIRAWEEAFNRRVQVRLAAATLGAPPELAYLGPRLIPLGAGGWTMDTSGRAQYFWVLYLVNRSPTVLPLPAFRLQADGLLLDCTPPVQPPGRDGAIGERLPDPGEIVPPGAERPFVCRAFAGAEFREPLRARLAGRGGTPLRLLPPHLASAAAVEGLVAVLGQGQTRARDAWVQRLVSGKPDAAAQITTDAPRETRAAKADPSASAEPAKRWARLRGMLALGGAAAALAVLGVFVLGLLHGESVGDRIGRALRVAAGVMGVALLLGLPWTQQLLGSASDELGGRAVTAMRESLADHDASLAKRGMRPAGGLKSLQQQSGLDLKTLGLIAVLALFALGRGALRMGVSRGAVVIGTAGVMTIACVVGIVSLFADGSLTGGEGWIRLGVVLVPLILAVIFFLYALIPLLLHLLHFKLDDEGLSWPGSVLGALRQSFNFSGSASQGEYWGFISFAALAAVLAGGFHHRAAWAALLVLALPTAALTARRLRGMSSAEVWGVAAMLGLLLLELLTAT